MLSSMFSRLFTLRRSIFDAKKLIRQENVDLHSVFDELDRRNKGVLTKEDVIFFLFFVLTFELKLIFL